MSEQYLVDTTGKTIGVVLDPVTYQELITARETLRRLVGTKPNQASVVHSIRELRGLGRELWSTVHVDTYLNSERDAWNG